MTCTLRTVLTSCAVLLVAAATGCVATDDPTSDDSGSGRGSAAVEDSAETEVIRELQAKVSERPLSPRAHGALGYAYLESERAGRAWPHLAFALFLRAHEPDEAARNAVGSPTFPDELAARLERYLDDARVRRPKVAASSEDEARTPGRREREHRREVRRLRAEIEAARAAYTAGRYEEALTHYEALPGAIGRDADGAVAACHLRLAADRARRADLEAAIDHLYGAADRDPPVRTPELFRDVSRLERQRALHAAAADDREAATRLLLRALFAHPDDPETLYLLARRPASGPGSLPAAAVGYFRGLLAAHHADSAEAAFFETRTACDEAPDGATALDLVDGFRARFAGKGALAAELRRQVIARRSDEMDAEADFAKAEYEALLKEAEAARAAFEQQLRSRPGASPDAIELSPEAPEDPERPAEDEGL